MVNFSLFQCRIDISKYIKQYIYKTIAYQKVLIGLELINKCIKDL